MRLFKTIGKTIVVAVLGWQLRRLQSGNPFITVGIVGSYGKTSTKFAVATVLSKHLRVRFQAGNYNDIVTAPLIFFGEPMPSLHNPVAWLVLFLRNERQLRRTYPYDVVLVELGTDGPGQIAAFSRYLTLDFAVLTAIAHEHMEFFADLSAVAQEELAVQNFSEQLLVNTDLCASEYLAGLAKPVVSFGFGAEAEYRLDKVIFKNGQYSFCVTEDGHSVLKAKYQGFAKAQLYSACVATIIGLRLGMSARQLAAGVADMVPVSGRMRVLRGVHDSLILDETYNASPSATKAALDTLYDMVAPQKVALLGSMNELGEYSKAAHHEIGAYCDPQRIDLVLTLGLDANRYLAPAARASGCQVETFESPYEAGAYLKAHLRPGAVVLAKGSQNKVFAEEAVKVLLRDEADAALLVRQSPQWLKKKARSFGFKHI